MKAKYYMRGIGLGMMILAGGMLVAGIPSKQEALSKEEIIEAAKQYGMEVSDATQNGVEDTLSLEGIVGVSENDSKEDTNHSDASKEENPVAKEEQEENLSQETESDEEMDESMEDAGQQMPGNDSADDLASDEESEQIKESEEETAKEEDDSSSTEENKTESSPQKKYAIVEVTRGMVGEQFANAAYKAGLISNLTEFKQYIAKSGYANRMHIGVYQIEVGSTYEEICKIITTRK